MDSPILTVSELTASIKAHLEPRFRQVQVKGEISNFKQQSSGHLYFTLKDASSQLSAVLFRGQAVRLSQMPKEGDQVIALGEISLYAPRGSYQIVIRELQFAGIGALLLELQRRKEKMAALGWFDPQHKKPLPKLPKKIGVITSPTGAVIQDILHVLKRRFAGFHLLLYPVKVQGEGAAQEIAQAIAFCSRHRLADVLIVGRGGGSIEDLWAFNEEVVAEAIFRSEIPIISAVGHETDFTIADWVADVRAPTPSAAAEIVTAEKAGLVKTIAQTASLLESRLRHQLCALEQGISGLKRHPFFRSPRMLFEEPMQKLDLLGADLLGAIQRKLSQKKEELSLYRRRLELVRPSFQLQQKKEQLAVCCERLSQSAALFLAAQKERLLRLFRHLSSLHPNRLMQQGYCLIFFEKDGSLLSSKTQVKKGDPIAIRLHDGAVSATITQVSSHARIDEPSLF